MPLSIPMIVVAQSVVLLLATGSNAQSRPAVPQCSATLKSTAALQETPPLLLWEPVLVRLATAASPGFRASVDPATVDGAVAAARSAVQKIRQARSSGLDDATNESDAAHAALEARDDLALSLPRAESDALAVEAAAQPRPTRFQVPGRYIRSGNSIKCVGLVELKTHRHLAPEARVWAFYFAHKAAGARNVRAATGNFSSAYIRAVAKEMRVSPVFVPTILEAAIAADTARELARASGADSGPLAIVAMGARTDLLKSLPRATWLAVVSDTQRIGGRVLLPTSSATTSRAAAGMARRTEERMR